MQIGSKYNFVPGHIAIEKSSLHLAELNKAVQIIDHKLDDQYSKSLQTGAVVVTETELCCGVHKPCTTTGSAL